MTTLTPTHDAPTTHRASSARPIHLSFGGIIRSEWIKLRSLRSTVWSFAVLFAAQLALGIGFVLINLQMNDGAPIEAAGAAQLAAMSSTLGIVIGQLVVSVLGVIVMTGEYGTGQIRSSLTAVPKRVPLLLGKGLVLAAATAVVSLVSTFATFFTAVALLGAQGYSVDIASPQIVQVLLGGVAYLALIAVFAFAIGALLRSTAGGIAATLGILLVLPSILAMIPVEWVAKLSQYLPNSLGQAMYMPSTDPVGQFGLEPWQALLVMLGFVAVLMTGAAIQLRRRDA